MGVATLKVILVVFLQWLKSEDVCAPIVINYWPYWEHKRLYCGNIKLDSESDNDSDFELDEELDSVLNTPDFVNEDHWEAHSSPDVEGDQRLNINNCI